MAFLPLNKNYSLHAQLRSLSPLTRLVSFAFHLLAPNQQSLLPLCISLTPTFLALPSPPTPTATTNFRLLCLPRLSLIYEDSSYTCALPARFYQKPLTLPESRAPLSFDLQRFGRRWLVVFEKKKKTVTQTEKKNQLPRIESAVDAMCDVDKPASSSCLLNAPGCRDRKHDKVFFCLFVFFS